MSCNHGDGWRWWRLSGNAFTPMMTMQKKEVHKDRD